MLPTRTDVAIIGAGPTGLALAGVLATAGVDHVLLDRQEAGANTSRAAVVHARTLEVLEELDATGPLRRRGIEVTRFSVRDGGTVLGRLDLGGLASRYPFALLVPQDVTEAVLLDRLTALGGAVHRPYQVTDLAEDADGVTVTTAGGERLRAGYVVGADGMHSTVRERSGIGFTGATYQESFVLADVRLTGVDDDEIRLHLSAEGVVVVAPLPGGHFRVVATVAEAPEHPGLADVRSVLADRVPGVTATELVWGSRFRVHHRLADRYRAGRLLLAGDAAHVHSPAGGQGMNTGIQDAVALGHALGRALADGSPDALDAYQDHRRPVAEQVVRFTDRMTRMATARGPWRVLRDVAVGGLLGLPPVRNRLARTLAELDFR
jgi:2-polyprenyl-6-methoxyphenol hydroxylase-like FAD-dependent oxidoreductase